jgi:hypothetical protein
MSMTFLTSFSQQKPRFWSRFSMQACDENATFKKENVIKPDIPEGGYIRRLNTDHIDLLDLFWGVQYGGSDWYFAPKKEQIQEWLTDSNCRIYGYSHNDMLLITLMVRKLTEKPWNVLSVDCICVHRQARGNGLTSMMLDYMVLQAYNMRWLEDKTKFSVIGVREISTNSSLLAGIVKPLGIYKYIWTESGKAKPVVNGERMLHLNIGTSRLIIFNTWRKTFPSNKEQWEVCWNRGKIPLDTLLTILPSNIQIWISSMYIDFTLEDETKLKGYEKCDGFISVECCGRPAKIMDIPYCHF